MLILPEKIAAAERAMRDAVMVMCKAAPGLLPLYIETPKAPTEDPRVTVRVGVRGGEHVIEYNVDFVTMIDASLLGAVIYMQCLRIALHHCDSRKREPLDMLKLASDIIVSEYARNVVDMTKGANIAIVNQLFPSMWTYWGILKKYDFNPDTDFTLEKLFEIFESEQDDVRNQTNQAKPEKKDESGKEQQGSDEKRKPSEQEQEDNKETSGEDSKDGEPDKGEGGTPGEKGDEGQQGEKGDSGKDGEDKDGESGDKEGESGESGDGESGEGDGEEDESGKPSGADGKKGGTDTEETGDSGDEQDGTEGEGGESQSGGGNSSGGDTGDDWDDYGDDDEGDGGSGSAGGPGGSELGPDGEPDTMGPGYEAMSRYFSLDNAENDLENWKQDDTARDVATALVKDMMEKGGFSRMRGNLPMLLDMANKVKVDTEDMFSKFMASVADDEYEPTWSRRNRRLLKYGPIAPGVRYKENPRVLLCADVSGSMYSDNQVERCIVVMDGTVNGVNVDVCYWDAVCSPIFESPKRMSEVAIYGGGWTNPDCVLQRLGNERFKYDGLIFLTDCEFVWAEPPRPNQIMILRTDKENPAPDWCKYSELLDDFLER